MQKRIYRRKEMNTKQNVIPVFMAVDNNYIPFLGVSLKSLIDNSSKENNYEIKILYTNASEENQKKIKAYEKENVSIEFVNLSHKLKRNRRYALYKKLLLKYNIF